MHKPYERLQAKNKLQLLQVKFTEFDYLQVKQFDCIIQMLIEEKGWK